MGGGKDALIEVRHKRLTINQREEVKDSHVLISKDILTKLTEENKSMKLYIRELQEKDRVREIENESLKQQIEELKALLSANKPQAQEMS